MLRWAVMTLVLSAFALSLGCGGGAANTPNPNNLEYSTEGPPKRDKIPVGGSGPKQPKK